MSASVGKLRVDRIDPPCWWTGMKTSLQCLVEGENLDNVSVTIESEDYHINGVYSSESSSFVFVDIEINPKAKPGNLQLLFQRNDEQVTVPYPIYERKEGSADRKSFSAADLVYLVMPDRFAKGELSGDEPWETFEQINRGDPFGRHGGNLQGIIDHLDYLVDLGVTALWITPPQLDNEKMESYHGYACADYYRIDPRFGSNELYRALVDKAHHLGLKVIMDCVPNHCGMEHSWMKKRPFEAWIHKPKKYIRSNYRLVSITDPHSAQIDREQTVEGWFDNSMPDLAIEHPFLLRYFVRLYVWWVEWADLDGLRVDTFPYNNRDAIAEWTRLIREEYPNLNVVAECWHSSPVIVSYWHGDTANADGFTSHLPAVMDFPLQEALISALEEDSTEWERGMNVLYEAIALDFLYKDPRKLMIFLDNHDTGRFADEMGRNKDRIKLGLTLLATLRGIPQLYYGTEFGFTSLDPHGGHGPARIDFPGGWKEDKKDFFEGRGLNDDERDIFDFTRFLFNWRKNKQVIHVGKTTHFLPSENVYAFFRYTAMELVFVFLNPSGRDVSIDWEHYDERLADYSHGRELFTGEQVRVGHPYTVKARQSAIIEMSKKIR